MPPLDHVAVPVFCTVTEMPMTWPGRACARSAVAVWDTNEYRQVGEGAAGAASGAGVAGAGVAACPGGATLVHLTSGTMLVIHV